MGEHEAMIRVLDERTALMATDIAEIKNILAERKGERRALVRSVSLVSAAFASIATLAFKYLLAKLSMA